MAIKYNDLVRKITDRPLDEAELAYIDKLEKWIDDKLSKWDPKNCNFSIELCYADFSQSPFDVNCRWDTITKQKMSRNLDNRYEEAGWVISHSYDDGLDGPNRSGPDYWILNY